MDCATPSRLGLWSYLRHIVDPLLDKSCYAFRLPREGHQSRITTLCQHFALTTGKTKPTLVGECDIRGFFDSVSPTHEAGTAGHAFSGGCTVDARLLVFLGSFFGGYDS